MKATELMISDWVHCITSNEFLQIYRLNVCDRHIADDGLFSDMKDRIDILTDIEGIKLTEEILLKNGFHHQIIDDEDCLYMNIGYSTSVCQRFKDGYWGKGFSIRNKGIIIQGKDIPYVHEFQHSLRLAGLDELADNFKI